jgi:hypothetical protein
VKPLRDSVPAALLWRYGCHAAMLGFSLVNERRPAPSLPDTLLAHLPRIPWIATWNYWLWLVCYVPAALWLWRRDRPVFLRFLYLGGWLSLLRGVCVGITGLGPVYGPDLNAGISWEALLPAWLALVNPISALAGPAPQLYLTKDLFFSGHVSSTFLLWLYCRGKGSLGTIAGVGHAGTVAVVFLSHLHYGIDVVGAWAVTFSVYVLAEGWRARAADRAAAG